jgi:hypothetical protein
VLKSRRSCESERFSILCPRRGVVFAGELAGSAETETGVFTLARPNGVLFVGDLGLPKLSGSVCAGVPVLGVRILCPKGVVFVGPSSTSADTGVCTLAGPNGVLLVGDRGRPVLSASSFCTGVPVLGVRSTLSRCALARARSSIQLGALFFEGASLGLSGLANALSIQDVFVGLQRFDGLLGGEVAPELS